MAQVQLTFVAESGLDMAAQLRNFIVALQFGNSVPTAEQIAAESEVPQSESPAATQETPRTVQGEEAKEGKARGGRKAKAAQETEEKEETKKEVPVQEVEKTVEQKSISSENQKETPAPIGELVDDGKKQPPTIDGCRIMIRRVSRNAKYGVEGAKDVLKKFGVSGAGQVPDENVRISLTTAKNF